MIREEELASFLRCTSCNTAGLVAESDHVRCSGCGTEWSVKNGRVYIVQPPGDAPDSGQSTEYASWSNWRRANYHFFKENLPSNQTLRVLDIGAGPTQFRSLFAGYTTFIGLDFFPYEEVQVVADISQPLPIADASFDIVILSNVLEHTPDVSALLCEVRRVLRPEGVCLATTPFLMRIHQAPYDYNRLTCYQLDRSFTEAGFSSVSVLPIGKPVHVLMTMQRHFFDTLTLSLRGHSLRALLMPVVWLARVVTRITVLVFGSLYNQATPNDRYTEGYGTVARL
jgi:SAM-dependent methyltransferase